MICSFTSQYGYCIDIPPRLTEFKGSKRRNSRTTGDKNIGKYADSKTTKRTPRQRALPTQGQYLECMGGVMDAVDAEAVVEGEAGGPGGKQGQLQALAGGLRRARLAHQAVRSQLLHENMATLLLELQVAGG